MLTFLREAPLRGAFFVSLLWLCLPVRASLADDCRPSVHSRVYEVSDVIDGDTLRLDDGRSVRLIGLDTPELGRAGVPDAPYAEAARSALQGLVEASGHRVLLEPGAERRDRHRRLLAHLHAMDGSNLTAELLKRGLGYQAVVAPNIRHFSCYQKAEQQARETGLALWSRALLQAAKARDVEPGFHVMQGRVESTGTSKQAVWLNLQGGVAVKVSWAVWREMTPDDPDAFEAQRLEVRGWFYRHRGRLKLTLSHPGAIRWL
jgi:endonuclease YncB( thermonuclease family)